MLTHEEIKSTMRQLIADAMYMEVNEIEENQLFSDFGLESVTLAKVVGKLCDKYSCSIEIRELLPHQTLVEASTFIHNKLLEVEEA